jgi:oxygen-independent coproporphyrinogen-3 oxidase
MASGDLSAHWARLDGDPLRDAFPSRRPLPPWTGRRPLPSVTYDACWQDVLASPPERRKRVVYVHVPFCINHCLFSGFYRGPAVADAMPDYVDAVVEDVDREARTPNVSCAPVHAVYLGGGTPTALTARDLHRLIAAVASRLPLAPDCEITVEGRVFGFDDEKVDACLEAGANRLSIGVQTFDTAIRRRQGRPSSRSGTPQGCSRTPGRSCVSPTQGDSGGRTWRAGCSPPWACCRKGRRRRPLPRRLS